MAKQTTKTTKSKKSTSKTTKSVKAKKPTAKTTKPKKSTVKAPQITSAEERLKEEAEVEMQRLREILREAKVSKARIKALEPIIANTAWMMVKLNDARALIKGSNIAIPYDNGGGQTGIRENPAFRGYEALWKSYMAGMKQIIEALPEEAENRQVEMEKPRTMLEIIRERHKTS